jgi:hypothetical protein
MAVHGRRWHLASVREEEERSGGLRGPKGRMGRLAAGPIRPKVKEKNLLNKKLDFKYKKALEICRRRFMRNFDLRIFPKIF